MNMGKERFAYNDLGRMRRLGVRVPHGAPNSAGTTESQTCSGFFLHLIKLG